MARSPEPEEPAQPAPEATDTTMEPQTSTKPEQPTSPARSDKSSDSEGRPVREKLKETRIDAQAASDAPPSSDQLMDDAPNGTRGDISTSGSESERGRLRRKRSREDFEDDHEEAKHPEKKHERHTRKKSRDITSPKDIEIPVPPLTSTTPVPKIDEHETDETMHNIDEPAPAKTSTTDRQITPEPGVPIKEATVTSPNNKRTLDQVEPSGVQIGSITDSSKDTAANANAGDERDTKRPRDEVVSQAAIQTTESAAKIPAGSGFSNTSSTSPFAAISPKPQISNATGKAAEHPPQTSDDKFKKSGFSSFSKSGASPFGGLGNTGSNSPFATAGGNKVISFASSTATSKPSGFTSLGSSSGPSAFGGASSGGKPVFGGPLGASAFGRIGASKSSISFGTGVGITGLTHKPAQFGAAENQAEEEEDNEDGSENENEGADDEEAENGEERSERGSQPILPPHAPLETGEEGEDTVWTGRAKLYTLAGETGKKQWHERGVGPFKLNVTRDPPTRARFVLRADGTHRLLLNAAVTRNMGFGDAEGTVPKDGKLFFTAPTATGEVESHTLKLKNERAVDLYKTVENIKESL